VLIVLIAALTVVLLPNAVSARFILFAMLAFYVLLALGLRLFWRRARWLGFLGLLVPLVVAALGLAYYYISYEKSSYRDMARAIIAQAAPDAAILLEAPRQHLLAKYYLPAGRPIYPVPDVPMPAYWPLTAPPVVPAQEDKRLQGILRDHGDVWLILAGQNEVDQGEFVPKYLNAIAYTLECQERLDVRWCHYTSPARHPSGLRILLGVSYNGELQLEAAQVSEYADRWAGQTHLLATLDWLAQGKPSADYAVTLRLVDAAGRPRIQVDDMPIGPLLPTTAWGAGDRKPGYMTLTIPPDLPPGDYQAVVGVYDSRSAAAYPPIGAAASDDGLVRLANVRIGPAAGALQSVTVP
jgi:hypothetical protein